VSVKPGGKKSRRAPKVESEKKPAWTVLVSHMLDRLRVNAYSENRPLSAAGKIGSQVSLWLTFFPDDVKRFIEAVPSPVVIPQKLPEGMTSAQYREMILAYPDGDGMSIMQILTDRIAHGDQKFMEDFAKELKPLNKGKDNANAKRAALYVALLQNHAVIEKLPSERAIIDFLYALEREIDFTETHVKSLLKKIGLPKTDKG